VTVALVLAAALTVACVIAVALPFLREPSAVSDRIEETDAAGRQKLELAEVRDRALETLKELEFDHRTGKVSDEDYKALVGPLRREAAQALRAVGTKSEL
jgi:hypothetical protein